MQYYYIKGKIIKDLRYIVAVNNNNWEGIYRYHKFNNKWYKCKNNEDDDAFPVKYVQTLWKILKKYDSFEDVLIDFPQIILL